MYQDTFLQRHLQILQNSYQHWIGQPLFAVHEKDLAQAAWQAPFGLLSHGTQAEPVLNYANALGLELFGYSCEELLKLPSRQTAEPINQAARAKLLAEVTAHGFIDDYAGVRISKNGQRFMIKNTVVWNLIDERGAHYGQAALIREYEWL